MKISHNWLRQFIKIDIPVDEISILLTNLGLEVENIETYESIKGGLKGVVVGKVISCGKHPNADRLKITKVDIGGDTNLNIVCGAPNVAKDQKVLVATIGTTLNMYNGTSLKISKGKIRGEISEGMICAEDELGLSNNHDGILVLDKYCKIGEAGASIFNIEEDVIFDIGLTPNRADAMSHMGVSRDLRAACILNDIPYEWNLPETSSFHVDNTQSTISIKVEDEHRCPQYHGITITNVKISPSPQWIQNRLKAIGITPKNNVVDVTNYLLHEIGQPLHAFDADKINGDIIVRTCSSNTPFVTLDGNERELNQEDLMICDNKKAHCIAGVFGGIDSGVEDQTTNVFIESAYFDPISIRKTAKRHSLNTDASFRFERGIDPEIGVYALKRAAILIRDLAGGIISSDIQEATRPLEEPSKIFLSYTELNKTIGQEIDEKKLNAILNALEIEINSVSESGIGMTIPRYRVDVTRPADVIEEILRIYGYNKILDVPLKYEASPAYQWKSLHKLESTIANKLNGQGFMETINNSLTNPNASGDFYNTVKILNPLGKELSIMRQSLTINALQVIAFNLNRQNKNLKLYEFGNIYGVKDNNYHESKRLTLSLVGLSLNSHWDLKNPPNLFFYGKGVLIDLFQSLGYDNLNFDETNHPDFDIAFELIHRKKSYGHFGLISKKLKETYNIDEDIYIANLEWNKITEKAFLSPLKYKDVPRFPVMKRDFALLIDKKVSFESLENISFKTERKILKSVQLFDVFEDEKLPMGKKSYGITFTFQDQNKTLTDKHIDKIMKKLKGNFIKEFDVELR